MHLQPIPTAADPARDAARWLTDEVRATCAAVAREARSVFIQYDALPAYARQLAHTSASPPEIDPDYQVLADEATTTAYFVTLDSINFGSGYFPTMQKRRGLSGYFTVALALKESFEREGTWTAARLMAITAVDCAAVFGQSTEFPLMALFARALNDLGQFLLAEYQGDPLQLVRAAGGSAERLAQALTAMPYYHDLAVYGGRRVAFYKRAQLTAADLALALASPAVRARPSATMPLVVGDTPLFHDLDRLTIFADNVVPHVLRVDGLLRYTPELLARINAEAPISPGSAEEVELRACAVHVAELLKAELAQAGHQVTSSQLDYYLWNRGRGSVYKSQPRHRSPGVYY